MSTKSCQKPKKKRRISKKKLLNPERQPKKRITKANIKSDNTLKDRDIAAKEKENQTITLKKGLTSQSIKRRMGKGQFQMTIASQYLLKKK
jgi:hypothetical protein